MEEGFSGSIAWLLIALVSTIIGTVAAAKKAKQNSKPSSDNAEFPSVLTKIFGEFADEPSSSDTNTNVTVTTATHQATPEPYRRFNTYGDDARRSKSEGGRLTRDDAVITISETDNEAPIDFDLREAVIYSEILKPKFDE